MHSHFHILIVHNKYRFAGGEDSVVENEKKLLTTYGHSVTVYEKNNTALDNFSIVQKLLLPLRTLYSLSSAREIRDLIRHEQIDIVHVHNTLPLISFSAYYAAKSEGCALVQTLHNFRFLCPNGLFYRDGHICQDCMHGLYHSVKYACYRGSKLQSAMVACSLWLHRTLGTFRLPDAYITLTNFNQQTLSSLLPADKLYLKPNFTEKVPAFHSPKERSYFLYASRLDSSKGIFLLLESFKQLPEQQLVIIGDGPEKEAVLSYIEEHGLENVRFLGFTPHEQTMSYLHHAKALLFPSQWYEGFPVIIAESLAVATPIIGSNIGNTASIIEDGKTGLLFEYNSIDDCIQKIRTFSSPDFPSEKMEQNCRQIFEEKYCPEQNYQQLMQIYTSALKANTKFT